MCVTAASPHGVQALSAVLIQAQLKKKGGGRGKRRGGRKKGLVFLIEL